MSGAGVYRLPDWVLVHTVEVEPFLGENATGPVYGPPVVHRCLISAERKLIRTATGRELVTSAGLHFQAGTEIPEQSRITIRGRRTTAAAVLIRDGGGLPTPDHVKVMCE